MRTRAIATLIALGSVTAASAAPAKPVASAACVRAQIGGKSVCLAKGKKCNRRYEGQYLRNGFTCTKRGGSYKLSPQSGQQQ
ncbi:MAG: hypothetical protein QOF76_3327 [Solirubrobacteraceae bacterium]|nr:hypothetical protein [Solirubrobacteraceae bacterium]